MFGQSTPKVTVNADNATLTDIFRQIEQQTAFLFSYRNGVIDNRSDISLHMADAPVSKVLDAAFRGRDLAYSIVSDKSIVVTDKKSAKSLSGKTVTIEGTVHDETGEPLPGATVMVKGTPIGTSTDINGRYS
ncbi:MAG: carboxypeptidase-like regulatory domain-containing protein, partial [Muribaculaceae bacterium]|nr:carboxypeptidase-like regulatory domain-containing protein [Muribaculaceae bacterium]